MKKNFWYIPEIKKIGFYCKANSKKIFFLEPSKIWQMRSDRESSKIELVDGSVYRVRGSARSILLETRKYRLPFFEAKRGLIINFKYVTEVELVNSMVYLIMIKPGGSRKVLRTIKSRWHKARKQFGIQSVGD
jgi:DNA-binding LytR/AlgR family response regulator